MRRSEKKKVLIVSHALELGGAERALLGLLNSFDLNKYEVELFLLRHQGELMPLIPQGIKLLPESPQYSCLAVPMTRIVKKGHFLIAAGRLYGRWKARRYVRRHQSAPNNDVALDYSHKYTKRWMPPIGDKTYDLAISFLTPHYFVAEKVRAHKKIAWIHTDYSTVEVDVSSELAMWSAYDYIASISPNCTAAFCGVFPSLRDKIVEIENIQSPAFIRAQAALFEPADEMPVDGSIRLLSVGRFCEQKNFDNVPDICRRLRESGVNVKWYLIGFGGDEDLIRRRIAEAGMEKHVIVLGKKDNPYPYMKACDAYVQPSRYEGNCVCVHEAQILCKPVIITNYATAGSQLTDGFDGVVVPMDNEGCAAGIAAVLRDKALLARLRENTSKSDYTNSGEVEKLYALTDGNDE